MTVLASTFDRNLGGRDFDMVLMSSSLLHFVKVCLISIFLMSDSQAMLNHFAAEWKTKTGAR